MTVSVAADIEKAVELLRAGELVGLPTETVYGLAADARNPDAVSKIFHAKGRPADHPLIVHLPDVSFLPDWASDIPEEAFLLARHCWPGPLTMILKKNANVLLEVTGGQETVGVRIPNHPVAMALLKSFGSGVAAPSANRFGRISPTTAQHVREELGERVAMVLDGGECKVGIESTIIDLSRTQPMILRPGAITAADISEILGAYPQYRNAKDTVSHKNSGNMPRVSGSLAAHYAPVTPLLLVSSEQLPEIVAREIEQGKNIAVLARSASTMISAKLLWHKAASDVTGFAHELYASLRSLDQAEVDLIIVEAPPVSPEWHALADRLKRAAAGSGEQAK